MLTGFFSLLESKLAVIYRPRTSVQEVIQNQALEQSISLGHYPMQEESGIGVGREQMAVAKSTLPMMDG
jgi:hypothetical protein